MDDVVDRTHDIDAFDRPRTRVLVELAVRQHAVVAGWQLAELGFGRGAVQSAVATSRLHRVYRGVYAVGHPRLTRNGRWMAAVLASGRQARLSHRDAAALWGVRSSARRRIDITVPGRSRRGHPGIDVHLVRSLDPDDCTAVDGIPVTTIARTLLDLAEVVDLRSLARAVEEAERLRLLDMTAVARVIERGRGRHGLRRLRGVLGRYSDAATLTRSALEREFLDLCEEAGLPAPSVNLQVAGHEVDAVWLDRRLVVELDGFEFHRTRAAFERDRARDASLQLAGFRVLRLTARRMQHDRAGAVQDLRAMYQLG